MSAHQPYFLAWLGYWQKMRAADRWVLCPLEDYRRRKHFNRVQIPPDLWLTIPVLDAGSHGRSIIDTRIDQSTRWWPKLLGRIRHQYGLDRMDELADALPMAETAMFLYDVTLASHEWLSGKLGIATPQVEDRALGLRMEGRDATDKIVDLCMATGCRRYLSGPTGADYLDRAKLDAEGIEVLIQTYKPPSRFSAIDVLWRDRAAHEEWSSTWSDPGFEVWNGQPSS